MTREPAAPRTVWNTLRACADLAEAVIDDARARDSRDDAAADMDIDKAVVPVLVNGGMTVYSEESGRTHSPVDNGLSVLLDPLDGSRNFARGVPWYSFSACVYEGERPIAALVRNLATGDTFGAVADEPAWSSRGPLAVESADSMARAGVLVTGRPRRGFPCGDLRDLGAVSLDLCALADGAFQVYLDLSRTGSQPWDHAAGLFIAARSGAVWATRRSVPSRFGDGRFARRHLLAAGEPRLLEQAARFAARAGNPFR